MTIRDGIAEGTRLLADAGIEAASSESWLILSEVMGWDRATTLAHAEDELAPSSKKTFFELIERRARHEPFAQIFGRKEFWSLPFAVSRDVLCPRPDSETLIEMALELVKSRNGYREKPLRLLDLGTGSGCLILALLSELPHASAVGIDRSVEALAIASTNGDRLGLSSRVSWSVAHWGTALDETFDLIVSNPPYVSTDDWPGLAPEIRLFEPQTALTAGKDGLDAYRQLAPDIERLLAPNGIACFEHGIHQGDAIANLMSAAGLTCIAKKQDLAGIERCIAFEQQVV